MKRNRVRRFLQQKQYTIASFVLFAAIAAMTGVYMSNKITDSNEDMELARKQQELRELEDLPQGNGQDPDHLPGSDLEDAASVTSVIRPKDSKKDTEAEQELESEEETGIDTETDEEQTDSIKEADETKETDETGSTGQTGSTDDTADDTAEKNSTPSQNKQIQTGDTDGHVQQDTATQAKAVETVNLHFSPESDLRWPMQGDVLMNYSMDQTVYFATLEQYKYNPALIIAGKINEPVNAAATGRITDISTNEETGVTVTMDLGDGYTAVYGQLKEILYKEGAIIEAGNAIGYLAEPTKYYSVEGSNLYFELQKDQEPINPMQYIQ